MAATPEERDRLTRVETVLELHVAESKDRSARIETKVDALNRKLDTLVASRQGPPTPPAPASPEPVAAPSGLGLGKALRWVGALLAGLGLGGGLFAECAPAEPAATAEAGR